MLVEAEDVELGFLTVATGHDGLPLVVDVEHELGGLVPAVAEQFLEDEGHVGHQVDRVVPDDDDPGSVGDGDVFCGRLLDLDGDHRHRRLQAPHEISLEALCGPSFPARRLTRLMSRLAKLSLVTTVLTFLAVTAGGLVRASGSRLGCPGWPKCYRRWIPPAHAHSIIEMTHRSLVSFSIYAAVAVLVSILIWHRRERFTLAIGLAIVPLFIAQAALGAYVVGRELIWWSVVAHLALAMV